MPVQASGDVLAYAREKAGQRFMVALNLGAEAAEVSLPGRCRVLISTHGDREGEHLQPALRLRGNEGMVAIDERGSQK